MSSEHVSTPEAHVTHMRLRDIELPELAGTLVLVTLDNGHDTTRPPTLGTASLAELRTVLTRLEERAQAGEITAVALTGRAPYLAAGADLTAALTITSSDEARALGRAGHDALRLLGEMSVPTFAFINGLALGGGLEIALNCSYRTIAADVRAVGLPEISLGLIPGWGGTYLLPRIIGLDSALEMILTRAAANKPYPAAEAYSVGIADAIFDPEHFLIQSLEWASAIVRRELQVERPPLADADSWHQMLANAREMLDATIFGARTAPYRALDVLALGPDAERDAAFAAEDDALAELIMSDEFRASIHAFTTVTKAKRPLGAPDAGLARPITSIGVVGAGLMAAQLALQFAMRLRVPVVMRDLDDERVGAGLAHVRKTVDRLTTTGRMNGEEAAHVISLITGTTNLADLAGADFVIEAVTEELGLKRRVLAEVEGVVAPSAILATNTSALGVGAMADGLAHPERVVGLHFFNPVAKMPLVEIVRAEHTSDEALATAFTLTAALGKTAVLVADRPGFVVNRLLVLLLGEIMRAVESGTPVDVADRALRPLGLPMGPFALFDLVGPAVGLHVLDELRNSLGDRFARSPGLEEIVAEGAHVSLEPQFPGLPREVDPAIARYFTAPAEGSRAPLDEAGVLDAVLTALTVEVGLMLEEGVVEAPSQIDLCMILGAGWPFSAGGICPLLDRTGYAQRLLGEKLIY